MNFDTTNRAECIVKQSSPGSGTGGGGDQRCLDAEFASANPSICSGTSYLVLKPAFSVIKRLGSVQFQVFEYKNGVESQVIDDLVFESTDNLIFPVGVSSGGGSGLSAGSVTVKVTRNGKTASANVVVLDSIVGCNETVVASAVLVDCSRSSSLPFGGNYPTRLDFSIAAAERWCSRIAEVDGNPKDFVKVYGFAESATQLEADFIQDSAQALTDIGGISLRLEKTNLKAALSAAATDLLAKTANERVIILISDGENTFGYDTQSVLSEAAAFKAAGGIILCVGVRAGSTGFDILERISTGGFFVNAIPSNSEGALAGLTYLKSSLCASDCLPDGGTVENIAALDYSSFINFEVLAGQTNLLGNGFMDLVSNNGLYVQLAADGNPAKIRTIDTFTLVSGNDYTLNFNVAGNNLSKTPAATHTVRYEIRLASAPDSDPAVFSGTVAVAWNSGFSSQSISFTSHISGDVKIIFQDTSPTGAGYNGPLIDQIEFIESSTLTTLFSDDFNSENPVTMPSRCFQEPSGTDIDIPQNWNGFWEQSSGNVADHKFQFPYQLRIKKYSLSVTVVGSCTVEVMGSNDDVSWTTVDSQSFSDDHSFTKQSVSSPSDFLYYRVVATGTDPLISLGGEEFFTVETIPGNGGLTCYADKCDPSEAIGGQYRDPNQLPEIEVGTVSQQTFSSTKNVCRSCSDGVMLEYGDVGQYTTSETSDGVKLDFGEPVFLNQIAETFGGETGTSSEVSIQRSDDGVNWVVISSANGWGSYNNGYFSDSHTISAGFAGTIIFKPVYSRYYKLVYNKGVLTRTKMSVGQLVESQLTQLCKSGTATSTISQQDADDKATAAANLAIDKAQICINRYTSTKSYKATCDAQYPGSIGADVTRSATVVSYVSQQDADDRALAEAKEKAISELSCDGSNNNQKIIIPEVGVAIPYPSVKFVTGKTGTVASVQVSILILRHTYPQDIVLLLKSPSGRTCLLMRNCGGGNALNGIEFIIRDSAAGFIPTPIVPGSYKPTQNGTLIDLDQPAPQRPYGTTLAEFIGDEPNGAWSLWVRDFSNVDYGSIDAGWDITITTTP